VKSTFLLEAWIDGGNSAGLYWEGVGNHTVTRYPLDALRVDQKDVAEQLAQLLNKFEPCIIHGVKGRWLAVNHGFIEDDEAATEEHVPYLSEDQIVEAELKRLRPDDVKYLRVAGENGDLARLHMHYGLWLRNTYNLWHQENPHTMLGYAPELRDGADCNPRHPDNMSGRIIEKLYQRVKATQ
jgi:hypothetical protein